jgi:hypothetical protein
LPIHNAIASVAVRNLQSAVTDLDEQVASLRRAGIDPGTPMKSPTVLVVMTKDPDGNSIAFAQALDAAITH